MEVIFQYFDSLHVLSPLMLSIGHGAVPPCTFWDQKHPSWRTVNISFNDINKVNLSLIFPPLTGPVS